MHFYMKLNIAINLLPVFACHTLLALVPQVQNHPVLRSTRDTPFLDSGKQIQFTLGFSNHLHLLWLYLSFLKSHQM